MNKLNNLLILFCFALFLGLAEAAPRDNVLMPRGWGKAEKETETVTVTSTEYKVRTDLSLPLCFLLFRCDLT